jgi:uncharacterized protein (TIGR03083 family)
VYEWIVDALEETWSRTDQLLSREPESSFDAATPCPGWSVRDVLSHLIGFELMLNGEAVPNDEIVMPAHVLNPVGEINERFIAQRRARAGAVVLEEFCEVTKRSLTRLRALDEDAWNTVGWSPEGDVAYSRFQETRLLDSWIHLQDIRDALAMPEDDHGVGEEVVVNRFEAAMPYVIGRKAHAPNENTVRINLVGRLGRTISVRVSDSRAHAVETLTASPSVEITTPVALFWRRCAGRISASALMNSSASQIEGDVTLANAIADAMAIMI